MKLVRNTSHPKPDSTGSSRPERSIPRLAAREVAGLRDVSGGRARLARPLTDREKQILRLICDGLSNAEIAFRLGVSRATMDEELKRMFEKIDLEHRTKTAGPEPLRS